MGIEGDFFLLKIHPRPSFAKGGDRSRIAYFLSVSYFEIPASPVEFSKCLLLFCPGHEHVQRAFRRV